MYSCILFDIDGTLINTEQALIRSLQKVLHEETGKHFKEEDLYFALGIPGHRALNQLNVQNIEQVNEKWNGYLKEYAHLIDVFSNIDQVLQTLRKRNIIMGIVTSKTRQELWDDFAPFGLLPYFDRVICADDTTNHKPHPEPLLTILHLIGAASTETLYVGDTLYDREAAHGAGIDFALAGWGAKERIEADLYLQSPDEIIRYIKR